jgi:glycosyltransferase 2 family protein
VRVNWRIVARTVIAALLAGLAVRFVSKQWVAIAESVRGLHPSWLMLLVASVCVGVGYAVLIAAWRSLLEQWESPLSVGDATRIWFVSSLGKYVPGKVWAIGAMALLAKEAGASPVAATGSAIVMQLLNIAAGFLVIAVAGAGELWALSPWLRVAAWVTIAATGAAVLFGPAALRLAVTGAARLMRKPIPSLPTLSRPLLAVIFGANVVAWIAYGVGFGLFWVALLGRGGGVTSSTLAVYTASYLLGFLALVAPGGLGVREAALTGLLIALRLASPADAAVLAGASRIWLTVLEIIPGLVFLPGISVRRRSSISTPDGPLG